MSRSFLIGEDMEAYAARRNAERAEELQYQIGQFGNAVKWGSGGGAQGPQESFLLTFADLGAGAVNTTPLRGAVAATFTRATTATTIGSTGLVVSVASGTARSYYDPTSLAYLGYLAEGSRVNKCLQSEDFSNASWAKTDVVVTADNGVAPDGATTADLLTQGVAGTGTVLQDYTGTSNGSCAHSMWFKRGNNDFVYFSVRDAVTATNRIEAWFNINTGVVGTTANQGSGTGVTATIKSYPSGWYRVTLAGAVNNAVTALRNVFFLVNADASTTRVNNATVLAWGGQIEDNVTFASSYMPTTVASFTRNADVLDYAFVPNAGDGTWFAQCGPVLGLTGASQHIINGGDNNGRFLLVTSATNLNTADADSSLSATISSIATAQRKVAVGYGAASDTLAEGGVATGGAFTSAYTNTKVSIGQRAGAEHFFGPISRTGYFPTRLPDSVLQGLTA